jgi:hypothetical protein
MVAAKVLAQLFAAQSAPEWLSVGDTVSSANETAPALIAPAVWLGPVALLLVAGVVLLRILLTRQQRRQID